MSNPNEEPGPHQFPDRVLREALAHPNNLRAVLRDLVADLADDFDYTQVEVLNGEFYHKNWLELKTDVFLKLPFRAATDAKPI